MCVFGESNSLLGRGVTFCSCTIAILPLLIFIFFSLQAAAIFNSAFGSFLVSNAVFIASALIVLYLTVSRVFVFFTLGLVELYHLAGKNLNHLSIYVTMPLNTDTTISFLFVKLLRKVVNKLSLLMIN